MSMALPVGRQGQISVLDRGVRPPLRGVRQMDSGCPRSKEACRCQCPALLPLTKDTWGTPCRCLGDPTAFEASFNYKILWCRHELSSRRKLRRLKFINVVGDFFVLFSLCRLYHDFESIC